MHNWIKAGSCSHAVKPAQWSTTQQDQAKHLAQAVHIICITAGMQAQTAWECCLQVVACK